MKALLTWFTLAILLVVNTSFNKDEYSRSAFYIVIDKSKYEMNVFDAEGWLITYPVVFGNNDQGDKLVMGDRKTPEGSFLIVNKRIHNKWCRYLGLDYPTPADIEKFNERKAKGLIPENGKLGNGIGIHGTWPNDDNAVDQYQNWTEGCISLKNEHIKELYSYIPIGTKITIKR